jgi:HK97 family phage major capsid protein
MHKKRKALLEKRKALLDKIDAILTAAEGSAEKKLTAEQTEQRKQHRAEIVTIDADVAELDIQIEERNKQTELEQKADSGKGTFESQKGVADVKTGLSDKEFRDLQGYSMVRAFNLCLDGRKLDGIEGEMCQEGQSEQRDAKVERLGGNLIIPQLVLRSAGGLGSMELRDTTATGTTSVAGDQGGVTIQTMLGSLIDRLRKKLILNSMGVTMLGGLQGNIDFPKVIADDEATEKAENAVSAESSVTFSKISLSPRRLPVFVEVSRQLLLQTTADIEAWLRNDMAFQIAQVMDQRGIYGSGSGQPFGILNTAGVGAVALGTNGLAPTYDMIVDLETLVASLDADFGALGYITNTKVRGKLKKTLVGTNTAAQMIWDRQNPASPLNDYKVGVTNIVPSNLVKGGSGAVCSALAFGNFNDCLMGQWGGLEFLINPYSRDTEGLIRINAWTFYDFILRRVESFAVCKDILTT